MSRLKRGFALLLCLVLVGGILAACSSGSSSAPSNGGGSSAPQDGGSSAPQDGGSSAAGPKDGGTFTIASFSDIVTVNPIYVSDTASGDAEYFLFAKVFDYARDGSVTVEPWSLAAEPVSISEDEKTYTIKLKNYAKWSDGEPVTVDDLIFTINTIKNPDAGSPGISMYDKIESMTKIDDYTVEIRLSEVYAPFIYSLVMTLAPEHILKDVPVTELQKHPFGKDPAQTVTNGPWVWKEWVPNQHLIFERNPNYWGEVKPHIDQVVYKIYADQNTEVQALLNGDVDHVSAIPVTSVEVVKRDSSITLISEPGPQYEFVAFNFKADNWPNGFVPFEGQKTRQAIAYAINRQGMIDNVLKGTGILMNSPFLAGSWADPGDKATNYEYNPEKAKQLLAEDGWELGSDGYLYKNGNKFSFELQYNAGNSRRESVAQIIQDNLKEVGIEVKPVGLDFSAWVDQNLNPGKFQAVLLAWALSNPDPDAESTFSSKYFPPDGQNMGWYVNEELDQLWVDAYRTTNIEERKAIYGEIGRIISQDLPYVFLYRYGTPIGIGPRVHYTEEYSPVPTLPYGYFYGVINWWVE